MELGKEYKKTNIDEKQLANNNYINDLTRLLKTNSTIPTHTPKKFMDCFYLYLLEQTVTISIASPSVVSYTTHGFVGGEAITISTTGALPTGLTASTTYYVKYVDADTFQLTPVPFGTAINTSGSQSGTHTLTLNRVYIHINNEWKFTTLS